MASKQDLLEAHAYNRRRLVAAFVSGAPQGRDVESVKRGRPVVAGIAVSALLLGGAAIAGKLSSPPESGWTDAHVVIGKQSAARFVSVKGTLHPVLNATSARLMLPSSAGFPVVVIDDAELATTPHGAARGIIGAPDDLPSPERLVQTRWVSCLVGDRTRTTITDRDLPDLDSAAAATPLPGLFAVSGQTRWLVAGGYRFPVTDDLVDKNLRLALARGRTDPLPVPGSWLDLVPPGPPLAMTFARKGEPMTGPMALGGRVARVGSVIGVPDGTGGTAYSIVLDDGLVTLTPFAYAVYRAQEPELGQPRTLQPGEIATLPISPRARAVYPDLWPVSLPALAAGVPCVVLDTPPTNDRPPSTRLVVVPPDAAPAAAPGTASVVTVDPGRGALVRVSSTGAPAGPVFLVDQSGQKFALTDPSPETLARLGYAGLTPRVVPGPWALLLPSGPALSEAAALAAPAGQRVTGP